MVRSNVAPGVVGTSVGVLSKSFDPRRRTQASDIAETATKTRHPGDSRSFCTGYHGARDPLDRAECRFPRTEFTETAGATGRCSRGGRAVAEGEGNHGGDRTQEGGGGRAERYVCWKRKIIGYARMMPASNRLALLCLLAVSEGLASLSSNGCSIDRTPNVSVLIKVSS